MELFYAVKNWIDELCSKIFSDKITPTDAKKMDRF